MTTALPIAYIHEITRHECRNCKSAVHTSRLMAIRPMGSGTVRTMVQMGETLYDVQIETIELSGLMLVCQHCIDSVKREPLPPRTAWTPGTRQAGPEHSVIREGGRVIVRKVAPGKAEPKSRGLSLDDLMVD